MDIHIEPMDLKDYQEIYALWANSPGVGLGDGDSPEGLALFFQRNPGLSFVAREGGAPGGARGEIVGAVLGSHDGRRGFLTHLAVRRSHQGRGIGRQLVQACMQALRSAGIQKCHIFVFKENDMGKVFWRKVGWFDRPELEVLSAYTDPDRNP
jgi:putative acetyltransferase